MHIANARPLPDPTPISQPYWDACRHHQLELQQCVDCGCFRFPPGYMCPSCASMALRWQRVSGRGRVHAYTVVHRPPHPAFAKDAPYVVALIELAEGVVLMSNVVGCPAEQVRVGMPVQVTFDDVSADIALPKFEPAAE